MSANESQVRISAARIELECAHGERLSIEAAVVGTNPAPSQSNFLSVSAAYMLGAGHGASDARADACTGFAAGYRGRVGDEIAALVGAHLQDLLAASGASPAGRACDAKSEPVPNRFT